MFSLKAQPAPAPDLKQELQGSIVEMIFAGHALTRFLTFGSATGTQECVCGTLAGTADNPDNHHNFCPVARYIRAVEGVRKAALLG
jgi:hypothetical protein